jgi:chemotaxis-related protein WspD
MSTGLDACWRTIGVEGDRSCLELQRHVHCRNCPTFAAAAVTLLDRAAPPGYLADWAAHLARAESQAEADPAVAHNGVSSVVFRVETEWLALPTSVLREVTGLRAIHTLPHRRGGPVFGIINVRGELLICVSLAKLLGLEQAPPVPRSPVRSVMGATIQRLLVIGRGENRVAFPVGAVHGVHRYDVRDLHTPPATVARSASPYTVAILPWNGHSVACLDADKLLSALDRAVA